MTIALSSLKQATHAWLLARLCFGCYHDGSDSVKSMVRSNGHWLKFASNGQDTLQCLVALAKGAIDYDWFHLPFLDAEAGALPAASCWPLDFYTEDCDSDAGCARGLTRLQRSGYTAVPRCIGQGSSSLEGEGQGRQGARQGRQVELRGRLEDGRSSCWQQHYVPELFKRVVAYFTAMSRRRVFVHGDTGKGMVPRWIVYPCLHWVAISGSLLWWRCLTVVLYIAQDATSLSTLSFFGLAPSTSVLGVGFSKRQIGFLQKHAAS